MVPRTRDRALTVSLVTGGSGYFGVLMVERLRKAGHSVRVLDLIDVDERDPSVEFFQGDIRDPEAVHAAVSGVDLIFHNVAQVPLAKDPELLSTVNIDGTRNLLAAALEHGVRKVVHTSSSAVFGIPASNPVMPNTSPTPVEAYGRAKTEAEGLCQAFIAQGLDVTIVRPRTILGHGRLGIFGILFDWIADGADVFVLGSGDNTYQFVHADDLAEVCLLASQSPGPMIVNAGTDRFDTMRNTLEAVCAHAGTGSRVKSLPARPASLAMHAASALHLAPFAPYHWIMYSKSLWFDIEHAKKDLGWSPKYSNAEAMIDSYDWFLAHRADASTGPKSHHRSSARQGALRILKAGTRLIPG
ncbi:nucleoside-diphosphate-sugar epimerase [Actinobacteria bacterium IMCC26256]|nr:nucleoside-diphosphate-sugar epimerase [Actinobacteria bacterium IMCC26256]